MSGKQPAGDDAEQRRARTREPERERGCRAQPVRARGEPIELLGAARFGLDEPVHATRRQHHDRGLGGRQHGGYRAQRAT